VSRGTGADFELYLLRHADAGDPGAWHGDDDLRPLSPKGRRQAAFLAEHLKRIGLRVDVVVTSPRARAVETATPVAEAMGVRLVEDARLAQPLSIDAVEGLLDDHPGVERIVLVGHDPDFSEVASKLTGAAIELRKGAIVRIDLQDAAPSAGHGALRWLIPPGAIPD